MLLLERKFVKPTKKLRTLAVMESLVKDTTISQKALGKHVAMSGAMVNQYLRELSDQRLIRFVPVNGKSYDYRLTPDGEGLRREYFDDYCSEIVREYTALKSLVRGKVAALADKRLRRLVLFGASETCEVVLSALRGTDFRIMSLVDNDVNKQGQNFHGHYISPPSVISTLDFQAVIITSFGRREEIQAFITASFPNLNVEIVTL